MRNKSAVIIFFVLSVSLLTAQERPEGTASIVIEPPATYSEEIEASLKAEKEHAEGGGQPYTVRYSEIDQPVSLALNHVAAIPEEGGTVFVFVTDIVDFFLTIHEDNEISVHLTQITGNQYDAHFSSNDTAFAKDSDGDVITITASRNIVLQSVLPGVDVPSTIILRRGSTFSVVFEPPSIPSTGQLQSRKIASDPSIHADDDLVLVSAGTFILRRSMVDGYELAEFSVEITRDFYISKYEVTVGAFRAFVSQTGYKTSAETRGRGIYIKLPNGESATKEDVSWANPYLSVPQTESDPVTSVSWDDAIEYCNWRSREEGLVPAYSRISDDTRLGNDIVCDFSANGYRLPTEAEWQYAAHGGERSLEYTYSGSNDINAVAWYVENSGGYTNPVGRKRANELGIFDMSGNVREWCWDRFSRGIDLFDETDYSKTQIDPTGRADGAYRIVRGGDWYWSEFKARISSRDYYYRMDLNNRTGFRVVRTAPR